MQRQLTCEGVRRCDLSAVILMNQLPLLLQSFMPFVFFMLFLFSLLNFDSRAYPFHIRVDG